MKILTSKFHQVDDKHYAFMMMICDACGSEMSARVPMPGEMRMLKHEHLETLYKHAPCPHCHATEGEAK